MSYLAQEAGKPIHFDDWDMPRAKQQDIENYYVHLEETMKIIGFMEEGNPRQTMTRMRRLFGRIRLDRMELSIMRGMLTAMQNFIYYNTKKNDDPETKK